MTEPHTPLAPKNSARGRSQSGSLKRKPHWETVCEQRLKQSSFSEALGTPECTEDAPVPVLSSWGFTDTSREAVLFRVRRHCGVETRHCEGLMRETSGEASQDSRVPCCRPLACPPATGHRRLGQLRQDPHACTFRHPGDTDHLPALQGPIPSTFHPPWGLRPGVPRCHPCPEVLRGLGRKPGGVGRS